MDLLRKISRKFTEKSRKINELIEITNRLTSVINKQEQLLNRINSSLIESDTKIVQENDRINNQVKTLLNKFSYTNLELLKLRVNDKQKILLFGFYGAPNLGDELMLETILYFLDLDKYEVTVMLVDNPDYSVINFPKVNFIHYPCDHFDFNNLASFFDIVIFGGGALIDDRDWEIKDSYKDSYGTTFINLAFRAIKLKKKVIMIGLSCSESFSNSDYITKLEYIIDNATFFSLRDSISKNRILSLMNNLNESSIKVIPDILFANPLLQNVIESKGKDIGIVWIYTEENLKLLLEMIEVIENTINDDYKYKIRIIPFYGYMNNDLKVINNCEELIKNPKVIIEPLVNTLEDLITLFQRNKNIICLRYHAIVLAIALNLNYFPILYDKHPHYYNKINSIVKLTTNEPVMCYSQFEREKFRKSFKKSLDNNISMEDRKKTINILRQAEETLKEIFKQYL